MRTGLLAVLLLLSAAHVTQVSASPGKESSQCSALVDADFSGVRDAPTHITEATQVAAGESNSPYCLVAGYVAPQVGFELKLPDSNWNGKIVTV